MLQNQLHALTWEGTKIQAVNCWRIESEPPGISRKVRKSSSRADQHFRAVLSGVADRPIITFEPDSRSMSYQPDSVNYGNPHRFGVEFCPWKTKPSHISSKTILLVPSPVSVATANGLLHRLRTESRLCMRTAQECSRCSRMGT
jgi:hypothetical protein